MARRRKSALNLSAEQAREALAFLVHEGTIAAAQVRKALVWIGQISLKLADRIQHRCDVGSMIFRGPETGYEMVFYSSGRSPQKLGSFEPVRISEVFGSPGEPCFFELSHRTFWWAMAESALRRRGLLARHLFRPSLHAACTIVELTQLLQAQRETATGGGT